jgi:hypothetical protein
MMGEAESLLAGSGWKGDDAAGKVLHECRSHFTIRQIVKMRNRETACHIDELSTFQCKLLWIYEANDSYSSLYGSFSCNIYSSCFVTRFM